MNAPQHTFKQFYLQGPGTRNDAVFSWKTNRVVHVVSEVGLTQVVDKLLRVDEARLYWKSLVLQGWKRVARPRRTVPRLQFDIRD